MNAGKRRELVNVYRIAESISTSGSPVRTLQIAGSERAEVRPVSGKQFLAEGIEQAQADYVFRMTHPLSVPIDENDVLEWGGVRFNTVSVVVVPGIRPMTEIRAKRGATQRNG